MGSMPSNAAKLWAHSTDRWAHLHTARHRQLSRLSRFVSAKTLKTGRLFLVVLLPWAQEVWSSNLHAPTNYFFSFNELALMPQRRKPDLGPTWVQVQVSRHFPLHDAVLPVSRANKSRA